MRYLIKFSKESTIKFVAHLDLMRTIQRMIKRSGLPVMYSNGFNPHVNLSLAQPLSVGGYSTGDYFDASFEEDISEIVVKNALINSAPPGIKIFEVVKIKDEDNKRVFRSMAEVDAARYKIRIKYKDTELLNKEMECLLNNKEWNIIKKSKSGEKEVDIKTMIRNIDYRTAEDLLIIEVTVSCGSRENLSPELLSKFIKNNTSNCNMGSFVDIERKEMYAALNDKLVPLYQFAKMR